MVTTRMLVKQLKNGKRMAGTSILIKLLDPIWEKSIITYYLKEASELS